MLSPFPFGFLLWEIQIALPGEASYDSLATQPMVHAGFVSVSIPL